MAGHSRPKDGVASARLCPGHPRLSCCKTVKTWMPGTRPGMTTFGIKRYFIDRFMSQTLRTMIAANLPAAQQQCSSKTLRELLILQIAVADETVRSANLQQADTDTVGVNSLSKALIAF